MGRYRRRSFRSFRIADAGNALSEQERSRKLKLVLYAPANEVEPLPLQVFRVQTLVCPVAEERKIKLDVF